MEILLKILSIFGAIFAMYKTTSIVLNLKKDTLKKDFEIAEKFIDENLDKKHDYLVEIGYSAISGKKLDASIIRYMLSKKDPMRKLSMYHIGMKYIKLNKNEDNNISSLSLIDEINSKEKLKRKRLKILIPYIIYAFMGFLPLIFINELFKNNISILFIFSIPFLFLAGMQIYEGTLLNKSIKLCESLENE